MSQIEATHDVNLFNRPLSWDPRHKIDEVDPLEGIKIAEFARAEDMAIDQDLSTFLRAYRFDLQTFAADTVARELKVLKRQGKWRARDQSATDQFLDDVVGDRGTANEIGVAITKTSWDIETRALKGFVSDEEMEERSALDLAQETVLAIQHHQRILQEIRVRNLAEATTNTTALGGDWDTATNVYTEIQTAVTEFENTLGLPPTHFLVGSDLAGDLMSNMKNTLAMEAAAANGANQTDFIRPSMRGLPNPFMGMTPIVVNCMRNSAQPGATRTLRRIWSSTGAEIDTDDAYLFYVDAGSRSSTWAVQPTMLRPTVVRWRSNDPAGIYFKVMQKKDEIEVTSEAIHKLTAVT